MSTIGIVVGSDSDLPKIRDCFSILQEFGVSFEIIVSSAHRTPEKTVEWVSTARDRGFRVIIAAAGGAAHLPGVVAAHTTLPVIGIPIESNIAGGLDSILSIIQMPAGIPVAAMPAGKSGGTNAALFALAVLSVTDQSIQKALDAYRQKMRQSIEKKNQNLAELGFENYIASLEGKK